MAYKKHNWVVGLDPITNKNLNELDTYVESLGVGTLPDPTGHLNEALIHGTTGNIWSKVGANNMTSGNASYGQVPVATGGGAVTFADLEATQLDAEESLAGQVLTSDGDRSCVFAFPTMLAYQTSAPTEDNTGSLRIVVLTSEPARKYNGYLYLITEA